MNDNHLIVFAKQPVSGKVKTRIAHTQGDAIALKVYITLLEHTKKIAAAANCHIHLFVDGDKTYFDNWPFSTLHNQQGINLGDRMSLAFETIFNIYPGCSCAIIGSDCYELTSNIILEAFEKLNSNNFVIGPANDGGYYLLGMKYFFSDLFQNINWSTNKVYTETMAHISQAAILPILNDIDKWEDVLNTPSLLEKIK